MCQVIQRYTSRFEDPSGSTMITSRSILDKAAARNFPQTVKPHSSNADGFPGSFAGIGHESTNSSRLRTLQHETTPRVRQMEQGNFAQAISEGITRAKEAQVPQRSERPLRWGMTNHFQPPCIALHGTRSYSAADQRTSGQLSSGLMRAIAILWTAKTRNVESP